MKLNIKFNATKIDEIERTFNRPIDEIIGDLKISTLTLFLQKGLIDDNGNHGVSKAVAMDKLEEYLKENDKSELLLDIMEELVDEGFLSREINVAAMRKATTKKMKEVNEKITEI